jgi:hypothetical protein
LRVRIFTCLTRSRDTLKKILLPLPLPSHFQFIHPTFVHPPKTKKSSRPRKILTSQTWVEDQALWRHVQRRLGKYGRKAPKSEQRSAQKQVELEATHPREIEAFLDSLEACARGSGGRWGCQQRNRPCWGSSGTSSGVGKAIRLG